MLVFFKFYILYIFVFDCFLNFDVCVYCFGCESYICNCFFDLDYVVEFWVFIFIDIVVLSMVMCIIVLLIIFFMVKCVWRYGWFLFVMNGVICCFEIIYFYVRLLGMVVVSLDFFVIDFLVCVLVVFLVVWIGFSFCFIWNKCFLKFLVWFFLWMNGYRYFCMIFGFIINF